MKIGVTELIVIFIVALLVIGPDKLPQFAAKLGKAVAKFKEASEEATGEIKKSVVDPLNDAAKPLREAVEPIQDLDKQVQKNVKDVKKSFENIGKPEKNPVKPETEENPGTEETKKTKSEEETVEADALEQSSDENGTGSDSEISESQAAVSKENTGNHEISGEIGGALS